MRVFRTTYRARDGRTKTARKWYIEIKDHLATTRRFAGFTDKAQSEALGRQIERLVNCRVSGEQPDAQLLKWLEQVPVTLKGRLAKIGLLDSARVHASKPLEEHLADYEKSLRVRGRTAQYIRETVREITRAFDVCGFVFWADISDDRLEGYLADLRDGGIGARTFNAKLKAVKGFASWMVKKGRANRSPLRNVACLNVEEDRRRERRPLEPDEASRLLATAAAAPKRFGMTGLERRLAYRLAIESGLRANEIRTLTVASFDFRRLTVTARAGHSKRRREDVLPLRPDTAAEIQQFLAGKLPKCRAFNMPHKDRVADMLKADLADAGIPYQDDVGRYADFHALRHTTASLLADAGVHPRVAQSILRHSDANLTLKIYTDVLRGRESEAVASLPDFSLTTQEHQKATGTDGDLASCLALSGGKQRTSADGNGQMAENSPGRERTRKARSQAKNTDSGHKNGDSGATGERGFEPRLTDPESVVLPLHYSPKAVQYGSVLL